MALGLLSRTQPGARMRQVFLLGTVFVLLAVMAAPRNVLGREIGDLSEADPSTFCEMAAIHHERENSLPRALLAAVAMAESGRYSSKTRKARAWPWTINAEGRPYYFKTKREAIEKTQNLLDGGMRSIDIGCMQVNLRYHPDAFASLEDAFDPMTNVAYGADFLMRLRERTGSWQQAVANYHSQTASRGGRYFARVIRIWENERTRVANLTYKPQPVRIDMTGVLKPAIGHGVNIVPAKTVVTADYRPAPKVLDTAPERQVRETASAAVGLRLSIAEEDIAEATTTEVAERVEPKVLDPRPAISGPTQVAEAAIPGA
ncbi:transglycosylase SLT domain-containing protein [Parvibaculum sp.]|jgi:hypothetical protein|uniref:transglycosylase SLT domain-containing protein n=1 Tax=Parvibaculum sp. TaxID=2024848 RepID=UPI002FDB7A8F